MADFIGAAGVVAEVVAEDDGGIGVKRKRWTWPLGIAACINC